MLREQEIPPGFLPDTTDLSEEFQVMWRKIEKQMKNGRHGVNEAELFKEVLDSETEKDCIQSFRK